MNINDCPSSWPNEQNLDILYVYVYIYIWSYSNFAVHRDIPNNPRCFLKILGSGHWVCPENGWSKSRWHLPLYLSWPEDFKLPLSSLISLPPMNCLTMIELTRSTLVFGFEMVLACFFVLKRPTLWHCGTHLLVHILRFRNFHIVHRCSAVTNSWRCSCVWQINATFRQALLQNAADLHGPFSCSPGPRAFFLVEHGSADGWTLALHGYFSAYT